ncbi:hypothetical protein KUTeg_002548 [Tegillarca granosa]|uniref:Cytochrome b5 heme-binding domain-containing protein n=1 Tax=Tegillarca granosa TaxID=220873 RepID=A0ABQ9FUP9_TEGGR|nr:hypothetical protein KUTeg_002548 [Tegillarca granosa]
MGKGGSASELSFPRYFSVEEVKEHCKNDDRWLMIDGKVYDISRWSKKHPGGAKILGHYGGEDATDAWTAFHNDKKYVQKFMKALYIGDVKEKEENEIKLDFRKLRKHVEDTGLLTVNPWFYIFHLAHIILLEILAYSVVWYLDGGILAFVLAGMIMCVSQAQAGWTQHDYGHMSVFNSHKINHIFHHFVIGHIKAASSHWWNFRHFQHHAKPNVMKKDPDIDVAYLFLLGETIPYSWAKRKRGFMPYNFQHRYWFFIGPPLLLPIYFHIENLIFVFKRKDWVDLLMTISFFARFFYQYSPFYGMGGAFWLYMFVRFLESHWFTWVTQMSHIPMKIDKDDRSDWFSLQLATTCNVESSWFNDWFTGHLNFQIEHHLFPTMPRHNYHKIAPLVKSLCKKHGIEYRCQSLMTAFGDIVRSLKKSGRIWYDALHE